MTLENNILTELAIRKQGKFYYTWWRSFRSESEKDELGLAKLVIKCLICDGIINPYKNDIEEHGLQHLKESNLLPFL